MHVWVTMKAKAGRINLVHPLGMAQGSAIDVSRMKGGSHAVSTPLIYARWFTFDGKPILLQRKVGVRPHRIKTWNLPSKLHGYQASAGPFFGKPKKKVLIHIGHEQPPLPPDCDLCSNFGEWIIRIPTPPEHGKKKIDGIRPRPRIRRNQEWRGGSDSRGVMSWQW
jgi:hypothetical protein